MHLNNFNFYLYLFFVSAFCLLTEEIYVSRKLEKYCFVTEEVKENTITDFVSHKLRHKCENVLDEKAKNATVKNLSFPFLITIY